jgi:penicillin-binding protein 1C
MTRAVRSPGSTLKPLVYAMAFDRGLAHPQTLINDRPVAFGSYAPQNFDGQFRGELPVAEALRQSLNIPVVLLMDQIGPAHLMDVIRRSGVDAKLPGDQAGLAVALGGIGVTLNDLVQLYEILAQGGKARTPDRQPICRLASGGYPCGINPAKRRTFGQDGL